MVFKKSKTFTIVLLQKNLYISSYKKEVKIINNAKNRILIKAIQ